ncbi:hypothetical protein BDK51DRAFT_40913 [Blyttiomyces helicus]|uniref:Uncharacterized protein n=1 Tax=Blyttiomyces helicus TaxID=388810 RepID=A0A4P9WHG2_9FUNG|nr:hypothetical protein BDK51DRAFT_40913 [Blyttiomyces helicus]|eukprot:RKO92174.1 hypothetical protein BDK51DRAFT_40913 [Blyttiomyces helicus]
MDQNHSFIGTIDSSSAKSIAGMLGTIPSILSATQPPPSPQTSVLTVVGRHDPFLIPAPTLPPILIVLVQHTAQGQRKEKHVALLERELVGALGGVGVQGPHDFHLLAAGLWEACLEGRGGGADIVDESFSELGGGLAGDAAIQGALTLQVCLGYGASKRNMRPATGAVDAGNLSAPLRAPVAFIVTRKATRQPDLPQWLLRREVPFMRVLNNGAVKHNFTKQFWNEQTLPRRVDALVPPLATKDDRPR